MLYMRSRVGACRQNDEKRHVNLTEQYKRDIIVAIVKDFANFSKSLLSRRFFRGRALAESLAKIPQSIAKKHLLCYNAKK